MTDLPPANASDGLSCIIFSLCKIASALRSGLRTTMTIAGPSRRARRISNARTQVQKFAKAHGHHGALRRADYDAARACPMRAAWAAVS